MPEMSREGEFESDDDKLEDSLELLIKFRYSANNWASKADRFCCGHGSALFCYCRQQLPLMCNKEHSIISQDNCCSASCLTPQTHCQVAPHDLSRICLYCLIRPRQTCRGSSAIGKGSGRGRGSGRGKKSPTKREASGPVAAADAGLGYADLAARRKIQKRPGSAARSQPAKDFPKVEL